MQVGVFSSKPYDEEVIVAVQRGTSVNFHFVAAPLDENTVALCSQFEVVCLFVNDDANAQIIKKLAAMGVRHIALRCAGYNNVDIAAAKACNIAVSHVPAYAPQAVAEHAVAMMLTLNRKMHKAYNRVKEGNFDLNGLMGFNMYGKTAGIVGTGHIGQATARILLGFGCEVLCCDPYPSSALEQAGAKYVNFESLLERSQIISLHCPLNENSYHLISAQAIEKMQNGVMLINTSRGALVDTQAIIAGLKSRKIGYLGLDVYEMESELFFRDHSSDIILDDVFERLATFHNVLITGHQGFFTREALYQIANTTLNNIQQFIQGNAAPATFITLR
ncbi:2-hydroxyacid dehydrogenase [Alteromonas pelagimontana]|uniref:2-hydroxyacid dehydrogenase n=1 Tax=Alteromonas pelagimontana TaxID=1858656 RepID=A0A6N3IX59_9ALTE|nr:2-hydroxyacid dehydrogenase [Alteromonas pelagimontana]